jgi:hypothetical protein
MLAPYEHWFREPTAPASPAAIIRPAGFLHVAGEIIPEPLSIGRLPIRRPHSEPVLRAITAATRLNGSSAMRFMYIVTSPQPDRGPSPALMEAMGKLADREIKAGRMLDTGGLMPIAMTGAQVKITNGKLGVIDGPFVETKELIGGYAIFELRDMEEAVAAAREFMQLHLEHMPGWEGTCEVRVLATPGVDGACEVNVRAHA